MRSVGPTSLESKSSAGVSRRPGLSVLEFLISSMMSRTVTLLTAVEAILSAIVRCSACAFSLRRVVRRVFSCWSEMAWLWASFPCASFWSCSRRWLSSGMIGSAWRRPLAAVGAEPRVWWNPRRPWKPR